MANETKKTISFSKGDQVHVTFDSSGKVVEAKGFSFLLWSTNPDTLDQSLIGLYVCELSKMFQERGVYAEASEGFKNTVVKKVEKFVRKSSKKTIPFFKRR